jgi:SdiA-regulated
MLNLGKKNGRFFPGAQFILEPCRIVILIFMCGTLFGCHKKQVYESPAGYNFSAPAIMELHKELNEISGISYESGTNTLLAENDEKGKIFRLTFEPGKPTDLTAYKHISFGEKGDYEDIVKTDSSVFILISNGKLVKMPYTPNLFDSIPPENLYTNPVKGEFESVYYDAAANALITICKSCAHEKDRMRTAYKFDLAAMAFGDTPFYRIDITIIKKLLKDNGAEFFPSAAAIHPIQKNLYILSSKGKLLVITDLKGQIEKIFRIDPKLFPQPEGMTFAANGDLYISNEAAGGAATILKFSYKQ